MYKIVRQFANFGGKMPSSQHRTIETGLTLEEAQAHCHDPETSSRTATGSRARKYQHWDAWFDGYEET